MTKETERNRTKSAEGNVSNPSSAGQTEEQKGAPRAAGKEKKRKTADSGKKSAKNQKKSQDDGQEAKKALARTVIDRLKEAYPVADCTLDYNEAWKLLVSVRLAAQCTDARVNVVVEDLYARYPDVDSLAEADVADIEIGRAHV